MKTAVLFALRFSFWYHTIYTTSLLIRRNCVRQSKPSEQCDGIVAYVERCESTV